MIDLLPCLRCHHHEVHSVVAHAVPVADDSAICRLEVRLTIFEVLRHEALHKAVIFQRDDEIHHRGERPQDEYWKINKHKCGMSPWLPSLGLPSWCHIFYEVTATCWIWSTHILNHQGLPSFKWVAETCHLFVSHVLTIILCKQKSHLYNFDLARMPFSDRMLWVSGWNGSAERANDVTLIFTNMHTHTHTHTSKYATIFNPYTARNAWVQTQHCFYWCPGAESTRPSVSTVLTKCLLYWTS